MLTFTTKHIAKYRIKNNTHIVFSTDKLCYNIKSGRVLKQILKGSTIGYVIEGKFKSLTFLKTQLEKIPVNKMPF
jgi:hypothetical protein